MPGLDQYLMSAEYLASGVSTLQSSCVACPANWSGLSSHIHMITHHTHTHTHLTALCPGLPGRAGTRKVKPIWFLLEQETVSGSGISWTICKYAACSRQITTPAPTTQFFTGRMPFLPPNQQCQCTEGFHIHMIRL